MGPEEKKDEKVGKEVVSLSRKGTIQPSPISTILSSPTNSHNVGGAGKWVYLFQGEPKGKEEMHHDPNYNPLWTPDKPLHAVNR